MSAALIEAEQLEKRYSEDPGAFHLGPVSFALGAGKTVAFLGRNGAGKSTLFQIITGNLDATTGEVRLEGKKLTPDRADLKRAIGYLPQNVFLPRWATGHEILSYAARLHELSAGKKRVEAAEVYWDCAGFRHKPLASLSYGMQKRVGLALATLADPQLLVLDEPWSGLDVYQVKALDDAIEQRGRDGKTTIVSTHVAAYVAKLCDRTYVVQDGKLEELTAFNPANFLGRIELIEERFFRKGERAESEAR